MANEHYKNLDDLRTRTRDQLDEANASFWTDDQIDRYVNRAKDRVWNRLKAANEYYCTVTRTSQDGTITFAGESYACTGFKLVAGTYDYTLPPDFEQLSAVEVITSGYEQVQLTQMDLNDPEFRALRTLTDNQSPWDEIFFDIIGEPAQMRLAMKVDVSLDLRLTYVANLADLVDDADPLKLPNPLWEAVVDYATMFALRQDRSPDAGTFESAGDKIIAEFFGSNSRQSQDPQIARGFLEGV